MDRGFERIGLIPNRGEKVARAVERTRTFNRTPLQSLRPRSPASGTILNRDSPERRRAIRIGVNLGPTGDCIAILGAARAADPRASRPSASSIITTRTSWNGRTSAAGHSTARSPWRRRASTSCRW